MAIWKLKSSRYLFCPNKVLRRQAEIMTELLEHHNEGSKFYSDELGDLGLHQSFSVCISFINLSEIFRIKIYLGCAHNIMCKRAYTDLFKPLKTRSYKGDCLICPFIFISIKSLTMLLSPGCLEKQTTEQRL